MLVGEIARWGERVGGAALGEVGETQRVLAFSGKDHLVEEICDFERGRTAGTVCLGGVDGVKAGCAC